MISFKTKFQRFKIKTTAHRDISSAEICKPGIVEMRSQTYQLHTSDRGPGHTREQRSRTDTAWCYTAPYSGILGTGSDLQATPTSLIVTADIRKSSTSRPNCLPITRT